MLAKPAFPKHVRKREAVKKILSKEKTKKTQPKTRTKPNKLKPLKHSQNNICSFVKLPNSFLQRQKLNWYINIKCSPNLLIQIL